MTQYLIPPLQPVAEPDITKADVGVRTYASYSATELAALSVGTPVVGADNELYKLSAEARGNNLGSVTNETNRINTPALHGDTITQTDNSTQYYYSTLTDPPAWVTWNGTDAIPVNTSIAPAAGVSSWEPVTGIVRRDDYAVEITMPALEGDDIKSLFWFPSSKTSMSAAAFGIRQSTDNARIKLTDYESVIQELITRHGGLDIVFDGGQHNWSAIYNMPSGLRLVAKKPTTMNMLSASGKMLRTVASALNCEINGPFTWQGNAYVTDVILEGHESSGQLSIDGSRFLNANANVTTALCYAVKLGTAHHCTIRNIKIDSMTGVQLRGDGGNTLGTEHVLIDGLELTNPSKSASAIVVGHHTKNYKFFNITQQAYANNVEGGHMFNFPGESEANPTATVFDGAVKGIKYFGRPGVAHQQGVANGASGDALAFRMCKRLSVTDFYLKDVGEYPIDLVHGCEDVYVGPGNGVAVIENCDGSGIVIGGNANRAGTTQMVGASKRCTVEGLSIYNSGLDHAQALGVSSTSAIRILNADDVIVIGNRIDGCSSAGIYIHNSIPVNRVFVDNNTILNTGTQAIGIGPIWAGQKPSPTRSGGVLTAVPGTNNSTATGLVNGIALQAGAGGLDERMSDFIKAEGWRTTTGGNITVVRSGTKHLAIDASSFHGIVKGFADVFSKAAQSPISFQHVRSDGVKTAVTSDVDNLQFESAPGVLSAVSAGAAVIHKLYFDPVADKFLLQYGNEEYTNTSNALYLSSANVTTKAAELSSYVYLGSIAVSQAATDFNAVSNARWIPVNH